MCLEFLIEPCSNSVFSLTSNINASLFIRNEKRIKLSFEKIINNPRSKENFKIMANDSILISTKTNTVEVIGEVNQPGVYKFFEGYSLKDYLNISGGLNINAEPKEIWISYPDGTSKKFRRFLPSPKVYDSSSITIGRKPESEPLDKTEFAKEIASITSDFLQVLLAFALLLNQSNSN